MYIGWFTQPANLRIRFRGFETDLLMEQMLPQEEFKASTASEEQKKTLVNNNSGCLRQVLVINYLL